MSELKYAILGLIERQPITGYDITKFFNTSISKVWEAKHSQIYPELRKLVNEGLVEYSVVIQGEKLEKKLYTITPKGHDVLKQWLLTIPQMNSAPKDSFRMRLFFCKNLDKSEMRPLIESVRKQHADWLDLLREDYKFRTGQNLKPGDYEFGDYLLVVGGILREEAYIRWIDWCIEQLDLAGDGRVGDLEEILASI